MANLAARETRLERFIRAISRHRRRGRAGGRRSRRSCSSTSTRRSPPSPRSRGPTSRRRSPRSPPTLDAGDADVPGDPAVPRQQRPAVHRAAPRRNELAAASPDIAARSRPGRPVLRDSDALNDQLAPTAASLAAFSADSGVRSGLDRLQQTVDIFGPLITFVAPAQTVCNYGGLLFRNTASLLQQRGTSRPRGSPCSTRPTASTTRAPVVRARQTAAAAGRTSPATSSTTTRTRTPPPRASRSECEAGNEPYKVGRQVIGNVPATRALHRRSAGDLRRRRRRGRGRGRGRGAGGGRG